MLEGVDRFNRGEFFEAHDFFEELWMEESNTGDETFYRTLIHASVGCYHLRNKNFRGAKSQFLKCLGRLGQLEESDRRIRFDLLRRDIEAMAGIAEEVLHGRLEPTAEYDLPKLILVEE